MDNRQESGAVREAGKPDWIYDIQWGPEGQQDYAHVYDRGGQLIAVMKTHHAAMIAAHRGALKGPSQ